MEAQIEMIRKFNRFYTRIIGLLEEQFLDSPVSLAEGRVLLEVGLMPGCQAKDLMKVLGMDRGHLSRVLSRLESGGWLQRRADPNDGRARSLSLSPQGQALLHDLEGKSSQKVGRMIAPLSSLERMELIKAMSRIQELLTRPGLPGYGSDGGSNHL